MVAHAGAGFSPWGMLAVSGGGPGFNTGVLGFRGEGEHDYAGYFAGGVRITGILSYAAGQVRIDHPSDPENRYLNHSAVDSDEMKNVYDGVVALDANGHATVELPDWCEALNDSFRYQLTPLGSPAPELHIAGELTGNEFEIAGGPPGAQVCWQLTGARKDPYARAHPLTVEENKPEHERGYYLHPDPYGQPEQRSILWANHPTLMRDLQNCSEQPQTEPHATDGRTTP